MEHTQELKRVQEVFHSFRRVNQMFHQTLMKAAQPHGITPVQIMVLRVLSENAGISQTELSERIYLGASTTSGIVDRMEKAGLVARERLEEDRRAVRLTLTEAGAAVWRETNETRMELLSPLLCLPEADIDALLRIHEEIILILQKFGVEPDHGKN